MKVEVAPSLAEGLYARFGNRARHARSKIGCHGRQGQEVELFDRLVKFFVIGRIEAFEVACLSLLMISARG